MKGVNSSGARACSELEAISHQMNKAVKYKYDKGQQVKPHQRLRQVFIVTRQAMKPSHPRKAALDDEASKQQNEALLGIGQLHDFETNILLQCILSRLVTYNLGPRRRLQRTALWFPESVEIPGRASVRPCSLAGVTCSVSIAQHIDCQMHFAACALFRPIIACPVTTFGTRLQRAAVEDRGRGLFLPPLSQMQQGLQIIDHRVEHFCLEPSPPVC